MLSRFLVIAFAALVAVTVQSCDSSSSPDTRADDKQPTSSDPWECDSCKKGSADGAEHETPDTLVLDKTGPVRALTQNDWDHSVVRVEKGRTYRLSVTGNGTLGARIGKMSIFGMTKWGIHVSDDPVEKGNLIYKSDSTIWLHLFVGMHDTSSTGTFSWKVTLADSVFSDRFEPNNDTTSATTIAVDSSLHSLTLTGGDEDWFAFEADSNTIYAVDFYGQLPLFILTRTIRASTIAGRTMYFRPNRKGTFLFAPTSPGWEGAYGFRIHKLPSVPTESSEPDDTISTALDIGIDSTPLARYMEYEGVDWFKFQVEKGSKYTVYVTASEQFIEPVIMDENGRRLTQPNTSNLVRKTLSLPWTANFTGTAFVKARPFSWDDFGPYVIAIKKD